MNYSNLDDLQNDKYTALLYCAPGIGKTTTIGKIAEQSKGKTLILDVDRTTKALKKKDIIKDTSKIVIRQIDNINTFEDWTNALKELLALKEQGKLDFENIAVDNISELERCILSDLGAKGKNKGVPAQADYQYMQFKLVNSLRLMKSLGVNIIWTAWETVEQFQNPDGSTYNRQYPKINGKIVDNVCGLCDIVGKITTNKEGQRGIILEANQNTYAKNQFDNRKGCLVDDFMKFERD